VEEGRREGEPEVYEDLTAPEKAWFNIKAYTRNCLKTKKIGAISGSESGTNRS
jgi:hypothetical protein